MAPADFATPYESEPAARDRPSLLAVLRRRWLIVLIVPLLTGAAAAALAYANERDYESTAKLRFSQTIGPAINAIGVLPNSPDADNLANSNKDTVGSRDVADETSVALAERGVDMSGEDISKDVSVSTEKDSDVVALAAQGSSPERAQLLASTYAADRGGDPPPPAAGAGAARSAHYPADAGRAAARGEEVQLGTPA